MEKYLTIEEVANMFQVSKRTVENWIENKKLPCIRVEKTSGSPRRFIESDVRDWFESLNGKNVTNGKSIF